MHDIIASSRATIFYDFLVLAAMYCINTLNDWGTIASFVVLAVVLGGVGVSAFNYYRKKHPLRISGYYSDDTDSLLTLNVFHGKFKDQPVSKGMVRLTKGTSTIYIEVEPKLGHIMVTQFSLRFKGKSIGMPRLEDVQDLTYPYAIDSVFDSDGKTYSYQLESSQNMFKNQKYYYGFVCKAPNSWHGELSFAFSLKDIGRIYLRKPCVVD